MVTERVSRCEATTLSLRRASKRSGTEKVPGAPAGPRSTEPSTPSFMVMLHPRPCTSAPARLVIDIYGARPGCARLRTAGEIADRGAVGGDVEHRAAEVVLLVDHVRQAGLRGRSRRRRRRRGPPIAGISEEGFGRRRRRRLDIVSRAAAETERVPQARKAGQEREAGEQAQRFRVGARADPLRRASSPLCVSFSRSSRKVP